MFSKVRHLRPRPVATIATLACAIAVGAPAQPAAAAEKVKVRASGHDGRVVSFRPRGVDAEVVEDAVIRSGSRARSLSLRAAREGIGRGHVRTPVPRAEFRRLRAVRRRDGRAGVRRWLRRQVLVLKKSRKTEKPTPALPITRSSFMLVSAERLATLPASGDAYEYMKGRADAALENMNLGPSPSATSPWLPNFNGSGEVTRPGVQTLAAALVYARTGDSRYRDLVVAANRYLIGSEDSASTDGTSHSDKLLATSRNIGAYVLAADLVGMDPAETGSRPGYGGTTWSAWLGSLRTKLIGGSAGSCESMTRCSNERAHNWGAFATAARISIDIYIGDGADLAVAVERLKRYLGESGSGSQWSPTRDFDPSFACVPAGAEWTAINPASCGPEKDGMIVEDISRSSGSFPSFDSAGIAYTMESYQALLFSAILLERQGHDVFAWGDQALRRVMDWLTRVGKPQGNGTGVERHLSWIPGHFYGRDYAKVSAGMGRTLGFTDWLYAA